jgi:hypothetical protein
VRPDLQTLTRARRWGCALILLATAGLTLVGCSKHDEPDTPAISGDDPSEITVPTLPPTSTTGLPGSTATTTATTVAPTTTAP